MASICNRCALRLQRATQAGNCLLPRRTFSQTSTGQRGALPAFSACSNAELSDILSTFRDKHLIPAFLHKHERKLIFGQKYKQRLEDNPQSTLVGDEEIELKWLDRNQEIPNRRKLVGRAINLILKGESQDWQNLPKLLQGLKEGKIESLTSSQMEKIVRKAAEADKLGIIIHCLQQAHKNGFTLKNDAILRSVLLGLHQLAQTKGWQKGTTARSLRDANVIARLLESEDHGSGRRLAKHDPRTRPDVLGLFLELAAVYAYKYAGAKDEEGLVKAYAGRLISCIENSGTEPQAVRLEMRTRQWPMLTAIPVWHGLSLAQSILGRDLPNQALAKQVIANYEAALSKLASDLEARNPQPGTYDHEALTAWKECIRI